MKRLAVVVLAVWAGTGCRSHEGRAQHVPDALLRANFAAHRPAFERLLAMARQDRRFFRVAHGWVGAHDLSNEDAARLLTPARWAAYRRLFREADLPEGMSIPPGEAGLVLFFSSAQGLLGGSIKGYAYAEAPPEPQVASLDDPRQLHFPPGESLERRFVPLAEGWYLFYEVS
jgi:hypothetical protein